MHLRHSTLILGAAAIVAVAAAWILRRGGSAFPTAGEMDGVVLQSHRNSCGAAALSMVLRDHGIPVTERQVLGVSWIDPSGMSLSGLAAAAGKFGLKAEGWRLAVDELRRAAWPLIAFVDHDHYVVVDSVRSDTVHGRDPARGRLVTPLNDFATRWSGEVLLLEDSSTSRLASSGLDR